ncbi:unnamed protein product [Parajaminaea phylloscopi]
MALPVVVNGSANGHGYNVPASSSSQRPLLRIFFASATGTAQDLAYRVSHMAQRHHYHVKVASIEDLTLEKLQSEVGLAVFLVATAGNGSFPPSADRLWKQLLSTSLPYGQTLPQLRHAIFGLGDSSYPRFCWPERMLRKRLTDLGAEELQRGEGDEQHYLGLDGTFQPFLADLFEKLGQLYPLPIGLEVLPENVALPPALELQLVKSAQTNGNGIASNRAALASSPTRWLRLSRNERLTSEDHFQDVRLLEFEVPDPAQPDLRYEAGDIAAVRPVNEVDQCLALIDRMGWQEHAGSLVQVWNSLEQEVVQLPATIPPADANGSTSAPITLLEYLQYHVNPFAPLRPSFFPLIRPFATNDLEREKLDEFCTPGEGYDDAMEYAVRPRRTVWEVLEEFRSVKLPLERAAESLGGEMREREFSIASAPSSSPRKIQLIVAIVHYRTRIREPRRGVATKWLASLDPASPDTPLIPVTFRPSLILRLPPNPSTPIIAIGPGTGVAPLRGLILERIRRGGAGALAANNHMYLGCRSANDDRLLGDEWQQLAADGKVTVRWAISRTDAQGVPRSKGEKEYVQDVLVQHGEELWDLLLRGAWVYICGSSGKMPEGIRAAFASIIESEGGLDRDQAERFILERLENAGRWREECWS